MAAHHKGYSFPPPSGMVPNFWPNQDGSHFGVNFAPQQHPPPMMMPPCPNAAMPGSFPDAGFAPRPSFNNYNQLPNAHRSNNWSNDNSRANENRHWPNQVNSWRPGFGNGAQRKSQTNRSFQRQSNIANHNQKSQYKNKTKVSEDQSDATTTSDLVCQPCEKNFKCMRDKEAHLKGHTKCEVEGCTFVASKKILNLHFIQTHEVGKLRIPLKTTEDIEKWKEERRKNYPSQSRVSIKMARDKKKQETASVITTKEFSYKGRGSWRQNGQTGPKKDSTSTPKQAEINNNTQEISEVHNHNQKIQETCNSARISSGDQQVSSPEEQENRMVVVEAIPCSDKKLVGDSQSSPSSSVTEIGTTDVKIGALGNLCSSYLSSSDDEDEKVTDTAHGTKFAVADGQSKVLDSAQNIHNTPAVQTLPDSSSENTFTNDSNGNKTCENENSVDLVSATQSLSSSCDRVPKDKSKLQSDQSNQLKSTTGSQNKRKRRNCDQDKTNRPLKKSTWNKPTLLEMLLADDIRHERNRILQCVRTIVKKNFFIEK